MDTEPRHRKGIGLCLSGGGYRAVLFHLGALRRLLELGVLTRADLHVSSVSGGSLVAAVWAAAAATYPDWAARWIDLVEFPLLRLTRRNIRTRALAARLVPWNWFRSEASVSSVTKRLGEFADLPLSGMPAVPRFSLCATDMAFGSNWIFERRRMGDWRAGYVRPVPDAWSVAKGAAASACFPPIFGPMPVRIAPEAFRDSKAKAEDPDAWARAISDLRLTDGGNYDNLGLEPVWKRARHVLVSDAGGLFTYSADQHVIWRIARYAALLESQCRALRKRSLMAGYGGGAFGGAYWSVAASVARYPAAGSALADGAGYGKPFARDVIAGIRTDLDAFSDLEAGVLMNHGYALVDRALAAHAPELVPSPIPPATLPFPPLAPPGMSEADLRTRLAGSGKRRILGRF